MMPKTIVNNVRAAWQKVQADNLVAEYKESYAVEDKFADQWMIDYMVSLEDSKTVVDTICDQFKCKKVRSIEFDPYLKHRCLSGLYIPRKKTIRLAAHSNELMVLVHELAHHFVYYSPTIGFTDALKVCLTQKTHGSIFIRELERIFDWLLYIQRSNLKRIDSMGWLRRRLSPLHLLNGS